MLLWLPPPGWQGLACIPTFCVPATPNSTLQPPKAFCGLCCWFRWLSSLSYSSDPAFHSIYTLSLSFCILHSPFCIWNFPCLLSCVVFFWFLNKFFMAPLFRLGFGPFFVNPLTGYIMVLKVIGRKTGKSVMRRSTMPSTKAIFIASLADAKPRTGIATCCPRPRSKSSCPRARFLPAQRKPPTPRYAGWSFVKY